MRTCTVVKNLIPRASILYHRAIPLLRLCQQGYICIFANKTMLIDCFQHTYFNASFSSAPFCLSPYYSKSLLSLLLKEVSEFEIRKESGNRLHSFSTEV